MGALQSASGSNPALSQQLRRPLATKVSPLFLASALIGWDHALHPSVSASALVGPWYAGTTLLQQAADIPQQHHQGQGAAIV